MLIDTTVVMKQKWMRRLSINLIILLLFTCSLWAQDKTAYTADELYQQAQSLPKEKDNFQKIIDLLKTALEKSPHNNDIQLFLGRAYTWNHYLDSARYQFNQVLARDPNNEEAYSAIYDVEYWNGNYNRAIDHTNMGLLYHPNSTELTLKKAKALNASKNRQRALVLLKQHLQQNPNLDTVSNYYQQLKSEQANNIIWLNYEYVHFDKRYPDPWHFASVAYSRNTSIGYLTGRLIYSNRYRLNGVQGEIDAYPHLSKNIYGYVGVAFSNADIFQRFKVGASLYYTLPKSFEAEAGYRYLDYRTTEAHIYVLGLGKYVGNYLFNFKTFLSQNIGVYSHSHILSARYYFSDRFNYLGIQVGTGIPADDKARNIMGLGVLTSYNAGLNYSRDIAKNLSITLAGLWHIEEYQPSIWGNQISVNAGLIKRF